MCCLIILIIRLSFVMYLTQYLCEFPNIVLHLHHSYVTSLTLMFLYHFLHRWLQSLLHKVHMALILPVSIWETGTKHFQLDLTLISLINHFLRMSATQHILLNNQWCLAGIGFTTEYFPILTNRLTKHIIRCYHSP